MSVLVQASAASSAEMKSGGVPFLDTPESPALPEPHWYALHVARNLSQEWSFHPAAWFVRCMCRSEGFVCTCSQFSVGAFEANEAHARNVDLMGKYLDLTGASICRLVGK